MGTARTNQQRILSNRDKLGTVKEGGKCHFCKIALPSSHFCYGCKAYVCCLCDMVVPMGYHSPLEHRPQHIPCTVCKKLHKNKPRNRRKKRA